jgi:predicted transcriptional regulator
LRNEILGTYRGRLDIIADILDVASRNPKKTQIMYQANLSYRVMQRYLAEIVGAQLIAFEDEKQHYSLTSKGREFLDAYEKYSKTTKRIEKRLNDVASKKKVLEELCPDEQLPVEDP